MTAFYALISTNLVITPVILLILLATPLLNRKYTAAGRYYLWIIIMVALVGAWAIPSRGLVRINMPQVNAPISGYTPATVSTTPGQAEQIPLAEPEVAPYAITPAAAYSAYETPASTQAALTGLALQTYGNLSPEALQTQSTLTRVFAGANFYRIMLAIWLAGFVAFLSIKIASHISFRRHVTRWGTYEENPDILGLFNTKLQALNINKKIKLIRCKGINSPMLVGLIGNIQPAVLLPHGNYNTADMALIFTHELMHYKRRDLWYKLALMVVQCLNWFNPAISLMARQANKDIEDICDMLTVQGLSREARKSYGSLILEMATCANPAPQHPNHTQLSTCMNGGKKEMKQRFNNILGQGKKRGIILFSLAGAVIILAAVLIGFNFSGPSAEININEYEPDIYENDYTYPQEEYEPETEYESPEEAEDAPLIRIPIEEEAEEYEEYTGFVMPHGYEWRGTYNPYTEETLRITQRNWLNIIYELTPESPINHIHINLPITIHIIQTEECFVRITANEYLLESLNISLENGALIIEPPSANIFSNADLQDFTAIHIGISQPIANIAMTALCAYDPTPPEQNAISLYTRYDNPVHLDVNVPTLRLSVTDIYEVFPTGEVGLLELNVWGQSKLDVEITGITQALMHLYDSSQNPGDYNIRVFATVADLVTINGSGNPLVWIMFSQPEVVNNHTGEVNLYFFN